MTNKIFLEVIFYISLKKSKIYFVKLFQKFSTIYFPTYTFHIKTNNEGPSWKFRKSHRIIQRY